MTAVPVGLSSCCVHRVSGFTLPVMATGAKLAVCDPPAFYRFLRLVGGPLTGPEDLEAAERFIRTVVLHDELVMGIEPLPRDAESWERKRQAIMKKAADSAAAGAPIPLGVAAGFIIAFTETSAQEDKYGFGLFSGKIAERTVPLVELSVSQLEVVSRFANAEQGNPHYAAHLNYLQRLFGVVKAGGSILCEHPFPRAAIEKATHFPEKLFEPLDSDWKEYAQKLQSGRSSLVIPPLLSIVLNNCARRDAIPAVVLDLRREWAGARRKIWQLVERQENARTLRELNEIDQELTAASETLSLKNQPESPSPLRMLWDIFAAAGGGAATAVLSGGNAKIGALTKALPQVIGSAADAMNLFRRGAFDLAGRVRSAASAVVPVPDLLSRFLADSEKQALGYVSQK
jgi:hypothetical protein